MIPFQLHLTPPAIFVPTYASINGFFGYDPETDTAGSYTYPGIGRVRPAMTMPTMMAPISRAMASPTNVKVIIEVMAGVSHFEAAMAME